MTIKKRSTGINKSEEILAKLGDASFLKLWSYSNVFYKQGTELCDLLVIFDNDIIIFSDKKTGLKEINKKNWDKWIRKAVTKSKKQVLGAKRILMSGAPLFLDAACSEEIPNILPPPDQMNVHLVCVANGALNACKKYLNTSSEGLMITSSPSETPCAVNCIDIDTGEFIHFLDESSLENLLSHLDTIADFIVYLESKEAFMKEKKVVAASEESLLAQYLMHIKDNKHNFGALENRDISGVFLDEYLWSSYISSKQYLSKKEADKISYLWDEILRKTADNALKESLYEYEVSGHDLDKRHVLSNVELSLQMMASENRVSRRMLAEALSGLVERDDIGRRFVTSKNDPSKGYVFLTLKKGDFSEEEYRNNRKNLLIALCRIFKAQDDNLQRITGIATETRECMSGGVSEDIAYLDVTEWSKEDQKQADEWRKKFNILNGDQKRTEVKTNEYPI